MNQEYKSIAHAKTSLRYHIIFSTKHRKKALTHIHKRVIEAFRYAEENSSVRIIEMNTDKDHIHLLITFKPLSIEQVVGGSTSQNTYESITGTVISAQP